MSEKRSKGRRSPVTFDGFAPLSVRAVGLACVLLVASGGCNESASPTAPPQLTPTAPRQPTPTPPPDADLSGVWNGTASQSGATDEFFCPPVDYPVTFQITQVRGEVTFRLHLGFCAKGGEAAFDGVLSGATLSGTVTRLAEGDACSLDGFLNGPADSSHIVLTGRLHGTCNALSVDLDLRR